MRLTKDYLVATGFEPSDYDNALEKTLFEGMENGEYTCRKVYVYGIHEQEGKVPVEISNTNSSGNEFIRIMTDSVDRINLALSFLHIKEKI